MSEMLHDPSLFAIFTSVSLVWGTVTLKEENEPIWSARNTLIGGLAYSIIAFGFWYLIRPNLTMGFVLAITLFIGGFFIIRRLSPRTHHQDDVLIISAIIMLCILFGWAWWLMSGNFTPPAPIEPIGSYRGTYRTDSYQMLVDTGPLYTGSDTCPTVVRQIADPTNVFHVVECQTTHFEPFWFNPARGPH